MISAADLGSKFREVGGVKVVSSNRVVPASDAGYAQAVFARAGSRRSVGGVATRMRSA